MPKRREDRSYIEIDWVGSHCSTENSISLPADELRALAAALGRLAARRDLARAQAESRANDMISAASKASLEEPA